MYINRVFLLLLAFVCFAAGLSAQRYTISGYITDAESGERLLGASIYDTISHQGVVSNNAGFFTLTLPAGEHALQANYVGYHPSAVQVLTLSRDTTMSVLLRSSLRLEEVEVVGRRSVSGPQAVQMSAIEVPIGQIQNIPAIGGEVDVLKAIQLLPGVQSGSEGNSGIYVRGGGPDENLIMLDGVPLYNVSHAMGMFSVFNADAIKSVTLYKGNFPARFGSRLSSVIDIHTNDGNNSFWHGGITVGLIASKLNVEGPIFTKRQLDSLKQGYEPRAKTTFNISARRTYYDLIMAPIMSTVTAAMGEGISSAGGYYFYDVNAKVAHTFSDKDKLTASFYMGDDVMYARTSEKDKDEYGKTEKTKLNMRFTWGNILAAVNWEHQLSSHLYSNVQAAYTRYLFRVGQSMTSSGSGFSFDQSMSYASTIHDAALSAQFDYAPTNQHDIKFGANYTYHNFRPSIGNFYLYEKDEAETFKEDTTYGGYTIHGHEVALFIEDTYSPWQWLRLNVGLRGALYGLNGKVYPSIEPRVGLRALLYKDLAFKVSYSYMSQYVHLLSNSSVTLPTDLWVPITKKIPPMRSMQVAAGLSYNILNQVEISVEGYYKYSKNLMEYKEGATFSFSAHNWDEQVVLGNGWSYGVEVLLQRSVGPVTGWVGYTWSRTMRQFDALNYGKPFHAKYDREHDVSITLQYAITKLFDISATFVYGTGNRATLATQTYYDPTLGSFIDYEPERNNFKMPDYHRMDIGMNFHVPHKRSGDAGKSKGGWLKNAEHIVNISVYNVYNHQNPYMLYSAGDGTLYQISIFPILPSLSYRFKF